MSHHVLIKMHFGKSCVRLLMILNIICVKCFTQIIDHPPKAQDEKKPDKFTQILSGV